MGDSVAGQDRHAPLGVIRAPRIARPEVAARNRAVTTSGHGCHRLRSNGRTVRHACPPYRAG
jgi:hypothetical protein